MCVTKNVLVQQTLGLFGAYPEKQTTFRDLAETTDTAAVTKVATKQPKTPSIPIARVESRDLWRQPTKFATVAILNFVSTSNFCFYLQAKHDSFFA